MVGTLEFATSPLTILKEGQEVRLLTFLGYLVVRLFVWLGNATLSLETSLSRTHRLEV